MPDTDAVRELLDDASSEVVTDPRLLEDYRTDWWPLAIKRAASGAPMGNPEAVLTPSNAAQVVEALALAKAHGVALVPWGLGSSVVGSPLATRGGMVCDLSRLTGITALSREDLLVSVRAGTMGMDLEEELNRHGLTLGHSPQSLDRSTVGGWVATRATGQFSSRYGGIEDLIVALEVALPEHGLVRTPLAPRASLGPDLAGLMVGAEGTFGIVTEVTLRVSPLPEHREHEEVRFGDVTSLLAAMRDISQLGVRPYLVRGYDEAETAHLTGGPIDGCALMIGNEGPEAVARAAQQACLEVARAHGGEQRGSDVVDAWLARRYDFSTIERIVARPGGYAETIEVGALWSGIESLHRALTRALADHADEVWGHFSHLYPQGTSLYVILTGQDHDDEAAVARLEAIWDTAMRVCVEQDASIAHHHGIGLARQPWLGDALGDTAAPLQAIKAALDPAGVCNPGKLTDAGPDT